MEFLNTVLTILWMALVMRSFTIFSKILNCEQHNQHIVFALNVILLAFLNICIGIYYFAFSDTPYSIHSTLQKCYFGTSMFQLLLSYCVMERIRKSLQQK